MTVDSGTWQVMGLGLSVSGVTDVGQFFSYCQKVMIKPLPPLVVSQSAARRARALLECGYHQAPLSVEYPVCHPRYVLLLDKIVCPSAGENRTALERIATQYFEEKLEADHRAAQMSMRLPS